MRACLKPLNRSQYALVDVVWVGNGCVKWIKVDLMADSLVEKLITSFDELERCIEVTKQVLGEKDDVPEDVLVRVEQYSGIVAKQRSLTGELQDCLDREDWAEVSRRVRIINGLSSMIRDDAQGILAAAYQDDTVELEKDDKEFLL